MDENATIKSIVSLAEREYLFTIRVPFKALDDVVAKERAQELSKAVVPVILLPDVAIKLQRQVQGKPPEGIQI